MVDVVKEKSQLRIVVRTADDTPMAQDVKEYLLKVLFDPAAGILGGFKCQVRKFEEA